MRYSQNYWKDWVDVNSIMIENLCVKFEIDIRILWKEKMKWNLKK